MTAMSSVPIRYVFVPGPVNTLGFGARTRRTRALSVTTSPGVMVMAASVVDGAAVATGQREARRERHRVDGFVIARIAREKDPHASAGLLHPRQDRRHLRHRRRRCQEVGRPL